MQHPSFLLQTKGFLLLALFMTLGLCVQAQQSEKTPASTASQIQPSATLPPTTVYASHFNQLPQLKQEYMKAHPEQYSIVPDPVQAAASTSTSQKPLLPENPQDKAKLQSLPIVSTPPNMELAAKPATTVTVPTKTIYTHAQFNQMQPEKQAHIQSHPEQFEIID